MVRKLTAALLGVGVFVPGLANALGLGEIKLHSHLSEPLNAEIELVQVRELTESEILPGLASPEDFKQAGVERFHHLTDMKFEVVVNNNGRSYIKVKTRKPIREPFVNFLVEVHWPAGRLLREYTLLLDPPNFSLAPPQPVQPAVTTTAAPTTTVTSQPAPTTSAVSAPTTSAAVTATESTGSRTYGPTKSSDSLWSIARNLRPSSDVSIQQTMIAIQQLNPDAFINGNINLLKKGKILRGPTIEEARQISTREAIDLVQQQNRAWQERLAGGRSAAETETAQIDTSGRSVDSFEETVRSEDGRLRLVSADTDTVAADSGQGGTEGGDAGTLRARAELAEEVADKYRLENEDLKGKVSELEEQVSTGEKLLDLKDDQIAALQARLAKLEEELQRIKEAGGDVTTVEAEIAEATEEPQAVDTDESPITVDADQEAPVVDETVDYNFQEEPETVVDETEPEVTPAEQPVIQVEGTAKDVVVDTPVEQVAPQPQKEQTFVEKFMSNPLYMAIAGGGALVLVLLGLIISRRRGESSDEIEDEMVEDFSLNVEEEAPEFEEETPEAFEEEEAPGEETVPQTTDVLGEADIYIAYGRFPQAIEMLEKAAEAEPQRGDIRIKLLETCVEAKDQDTFMRHYQAVQDMAVPDDVARANALKDQFIGGGEPADQGFGEAADEGEDTLVMDTGAEATEEAPEDTSMDFDLDFDAEDTAAQAAPEEAPESLAEEESNELDFDLDLDATEALEEPQDLKEAEDNSMDFDLDLDTGQEEETTEAPSAETSTDFDEEFSLDLDEDTETVEDAGDTTVSFGEAEESLDFELTEEETDEAEESLDFDLDLDTEPEAEPGDETLVAQPQQEEAQPSEEVIDSDAAAKLADELDLDGDFNLDVDTDLEPAQEQADDLEFSVEVDEQAEAAPEAAPEEAPAESDIEPEAQISATPAPEEAANSEEELDFLTDADETSTKLDLARAYIDMGDREGAKDILDEVLIEGSEEQQGEAKELLARLD